MNIIEFVVLRRLIGGKAFVGCHFIWIGEVGLGKREEPLPHPSVCKSRCNSVLKRMLFSIQV